MSERMSDSIGDRASGGMRGPAIHNRNGRSGAVGAYMILAAGGLFVAYLTALALSDHAVDRPGLALMLNPSNPGALRERAKLALASTPPDLAAARRDAQAALRADPLTPGVHRVLAIIAAAEGDRAQFDGMSRFAGRYARDGEAQLIMLQQAALAGDAAAIAHRLDLLYRGQSVGVWAQLGEMMAGIIEDRAVAAELARKLDENPPWRTSYLQQAFNRAANIDALIAFYDLIPKPRDGETRLFLERLVRENRLEVAHAHFLRRLPPERRAGAGLLDNARFQHPVSNLPFDWVLTPMPGTLTEVRRERDRNVLRVSFFGARSPYRNVTRLMALPPGDYRFSGTEQAISFINPRGMRWVATCADRPEEPLGASDLLRGDAGPRPFAFTFAVGADCRFQILRLELAARVALEQEAAGTLIYGDLDLARQ